MKNKIINFIKTKKVKAVALAVSCSLVFEVGFSLIEIPEVSFSYTAQVNNTITNSCSSNEVQADGSNKATHSVLYKGCFISSIPSYIAYRPSPSVTELVKDLSPNI